jgi:hypothetical protein
MTRRLLAILLTLCLTASAAAAWAYWSAGSGAGGNGAAAVSSVGQGATPAGSVAARAVTVSWAASTLTSGQAVTGYQVRRYDATTLALQTILSACTGTVAATSCVEDNAPAGSWKYAITPVFANWLGIESAKSATVTVLPPDATPPTNALTLSGVTGGSYLTGTTVYYRGAAPGSFTLTNTVADAGSGPASSETAVLGNNTLAKWAHSPAKVTAPAGGPYVTSAFSWIAGTTSSPSEIVRGRDVAGNEATTSLSFVNDSAAPTSGTIAYTNGYQPALSVPVTFTTGNDTGSNVASRQLQRQSASLSAGTCGTWGGFANVGAVNPTSTYTDTAVANAMCYKYQYVVTDNVGNIGTTASGNVSRVDYANAVSATAGLLSQWRLGEAATSLGSVDSFNRTAGSKLTGSTADLGGIWQYQSVDSSSIEKFDSRGRAYRNGGVIAVNYLPATPATADYSVEADLVVVSDLTDDAAGVIGRLNTDNGNYYMARWENEDKSWNIAKVTGNTRFDVNWLNSETKAPALVPGQTYRIRLEMSGTTTTTLKLYVNGVWKFSAVDTSSPFTVPGKAGIIDGELDRTTTSTTKSSTTGLHLDNFQVTPSTYPRAADSKGPNTADYKNGVTLGAPGALHGDANTAAQFDGVNDYVQATGTSGLPTGAGVRSVEVWFKTSSAAQQVLFSYGTMGGTKQFGLWLNDGGTTMKAWGYGPGNDPSFAMPSAMNNGQWHQVVQTYDGTSLRIYIDGVALLPQIATRSTEIDQYGFDIGAIVNPSDGNSGGFFKGSIDEVSFYTTVLDQPTVTNHYQLAMAAAPAQAARAPAARAPAVSVPAVPAPNVSAPVVTTTVADLAFLENSTIPVDANLTVTDSDSTTLTAATVTMATNYFAGQDTLAFSNQNGITGTWTAGTGVMALSGAATVDQYQTAMRSITHTNNSDFPTRSTRSVTFAVSDGIQSSNTANRSIAITAVNDEPSGSSATLAMNEDTSYTFASADFGLVDALDNGANSLLAVTMTTLPGRGSLMLGGTIVTAGQYVSAADIASGLLTYEPVGNASGTSYAAVIFQVQDNGGTANGGIDRDASADTLTFNVESLNDAPVNSVPPGQSTPTNTARVFSTAHGTLISIADADATPGSIQVQLVSANGAATLATIAGLAFTAGDGTTDATMTFTGQVEAVNTALSGLSFDPAISFSGNATLRILASDQGNTGAGGTLTDDDTIVLTVTPASSSSTMNGTTGNPTGSLAPAATLAAAPNGSPTAARTSENRLADASLLSRTGRRGRLLYRQT